MELIVKNLKIPIEKDGADEYLFAVSRKMKIDRDNISIVKIISKSLDMKNSKQFFYKTSLVVTVHDSYENKNNFALYNEEKPDNIRLTDVKLRPIIVGFGPAGMFAALELVELGLKPIIFERGKKIEERDLDVQKFIKERKLNSESNIQFGEGGAGSYSDGKLFSRRDNNSVTVKKMLNTLVKFGAPQEIEYIAKPHLGTDVLCEIVRKIRLHILERGGEIYFNSKLTDLIISSGAVSGVVINSKKEYLSSKIYLALGHSARDTFEMLFNRGVAIEQKSISVGVRIEHPVETINLMRYGNKYQNYSGLGSATYSLNYTNRKIRRGVYTFCMCPGGEVINASSEEGFMVVNGMSYSDRSSPFSNGALIVTCHKGDFGSTHPLAGIGFQKDIERKAFIAGGGDWRVPGQNLMDFLVDKCSDKLNENSFKMGAVSADMKKLFPNFIVKELRSAFNKWKEELPLFVSENAILIGAETRASSPIRIKRNEQFESINVKGLYPIGEGSGYSGGITSSATDAIRAVQTHFSM